MKVIDLTHDILKKKKVKHSDLIYTRGSSFSLRSEKGELSEFKKSNSNVLGLRVIIDGRTGLSYTEATDIDSIKRTVDNAINNARYSKFNEHSSIESEQEIHIHHNEENIDYAPDPNQMIELSLELETQILKRDKRATNAPYNGLSQNEYSVNLVNSKGAHLSVKKKGYSAWTSALLSENGRNSTHYAHTMSRDFRSLDSEKIITEALHISDQLLRATALKTGKYSVVFDHDILESLFHSYSNMFSAKAVIDKLCPFQDQIGKRVIASELTIKDAPLYKDAYHKSYFDMEGFKRVENTIFENGVLKQFLHNSETAKELGQVNNFCAQRSAKSNLSLGVTNLLIGPSDDKSADLSKINYVEIISVQGLRSGINQISGDFSAGIKGRVWQDGQIVSYFNECTISANFFDMLKEVEFIGNSLESNVSKSFFSPTIVFPNIQIAGL